MPIDDRSLAGSRPLPILYSLLLILHL